MSDRLTKEDRDALDEAILSVASEANDAPPSASSQVDVVVLLVELSLSLRSSI